VLKKQWRAFSIPFQLQELLSKETRGVVRQILNKLDERDRRLLTKVFLEEREKDEICAEFGVDRSYLRVLLHRAKLAFRSRYTLSSRRTCSSPKMVM
jgi:RNA polymerase sigma-70 factor (ECF subfamily)